MPKNDGKVAVRLPGLGQASQPTQLLDWFVAAQGALRARRGAEAMLPLQQILSAYPDHPDALNLMSVALGQLGEHPKGAELSRRAIAQKPDDANFHLNLGNRLIDQGLYEQAELAYRHARDLAPDDFAIGRGLLLALAWQQRWIEALQLARELEARIEDPDLCARCGEIALLAGEQRVALTFYQRALASDPDDVERLMQVARVAMLLEDLETGLHTAERVLELQDVHEARSMIAAIRHRQRDYAGMTLILEGITEASDQAANANNLKGMMLASQGRIEDALPVMAKNEHLAKDAFPLQATRVMYLNYAPGISRAALRRAHDDFGARFENAVPALTRRQTPDRTPGRRLRIGLISPDLRTHSVVYFILPFLEAFDRDALEVVAFASVAQPDVMTDRLKSLATEWHDVLEMSDFQLAQSINDRRIDILIDLAGLTRGSRILAFTARPAPVQMTYIGYPNTTGLPQIDYRITDWIADPDGADDDYVETLIRLPHCFLCYAVPAFAPAIGPPPTGRNGHATFSSFNNLAKVNREVVGLWARVLREVPDARMLLKATGSTDPVAQETLRRRFADEGVDPGRIAFEDYARLAQDHLDVYNHVDVALDSFPYNGATTTCEALWMGVPVVTLAGDRHAGRVGASLLSAVGLNANVCATPDDFVMTARLYAEHPSLLAACRHRLRDDLVRSPLCNNRLHARTLEDAFRAAWEIWCETQPAAPNTA